MKAKTKGMLYIAACVTLWSFTGILTKSIPWNGMAIAGWRGFVGAAVMFAFMKKRGVPLVLDKRVWLIGACVAISALSCLVANKLTAAANVIMLQYTAPVFLIVLSMIFYKRRYGLFDYSVVAITLLGIVLFFFDELSPGSLLGNLCALACGITYGGMYLFSEEASMDERICGILLGFVLTGICGAPFVFAGDCEFSIKSVGMVLLMGAVFYGLPYMFYALSLRDCPALAAILISCIEIILNPVWVYLFIGELPGVWALVGSAVILTTILVYSIRNALKEQNAAKAVRE